MRAEKEGKRKGEKESGDVEVVVVVGVEDAE